MPGGTEGADGSNVIWLGGPGVGAGVGVSLGEVPTVLAKGVLLVTGLLLASPIVSPPDSSMTIREKPTTIASIFLFRNRSFFINFLSFIAGAMSPSPQDHAWGNTARLNNVRDV
jgi:hypothetical protein